MSVLLIFASLAMIPGDWPGFMGPNRNGIVSETRVVPSLGEKGPRILWTIEVGETYAGPAIANQRLFMFDRMDNQARLSCYDSVSGKMHWRSGYSTHYEDMYKFGNGPRAMPVVDGNRVYTYGAEGMLHCWDARDGKLIWQINTIEQFGVVQNFFGVGAAPVIYKNLLIAQVGGSPAGSPSISTGKVKGNGSGVVAFDKMTGKVIYKISDELASYATPALASGNDRDWALVLARGGLLAFRPDNGKIDFHYPFRAAKLESVNAATPVIFGDKVFLTESYELGAAVLRFAGAKPELIWRDSSRRNQTMASHWTTPIYYEGFLYGCHGEKLRSAELRCLNPQTGEVKWSHPGLRRTTMVLVSGVLLVLSENGELVLVKADPAGYKELGRADLVDGPAWHPPAVSNGKIYVLGKNKLVCLALRSR